MKTAIITGASGGIGKSLALKLVSEYHVVLVARSKQALEAVNTQIVEAGGTAELVVADLTKKADRKKLYSMTQDRSIDLLVNNAGVGGQSDFISQDEAKIQTIIDLNITALTELTRHYAPRMKSDSAIMNIASVVGFVPFPSIAVYAATKAYVLSLSEALAEELKPRGIHVLAVCPGATSTGFDAAANMQDTVVYSRNLPGPDEVADDAIHALKRKKGITIHGWGNRMLIFVATRLLPRSLVRRLTRRAL